MAIEQQETTRWSCQQAARASHCSLLAVEILALLPNEPCSAGTAVCILCRARRDAIDSDRDQTCSGSRLMMLRIIDHHSAGAPQRCECDPVPSLCFPARVLTAPTAPSAIDLDEDQDHQDHCGLQSLWAGKIARGV